MEKNPFEDTSPEWQLFERAKAEELAAVAHAQDAERSQKRAAKCRETAALFREALNKLTGKDG